MKQIFEPGEMFEIPDGTLLSPFINPKDSMSGLPFDLIDGFSIAYGVVNGHSESKIHVHPHVDQVTYVVDGNISLRMKGAEDKKPYTLELKSNQAAISRGGEFFQLVNEGDQNCSVLYIVSPAYLFEMDEGKILYDDAIILSSTWDELAAINWQPEELASEISSLESRSKSLERLKEKSR